MRVYIFGIGGVGKTTVGQRVAERFGCEHISGSSLMMKLSGTKSREELEKISPEMQMAIEEIVYPEYVNSEESIVVDGHGTLTDQQLDCFDEIIYLYASPSDIAKRRADRGRRETSVEEIENEMDIYNEKLVRLAERTKVKTVHCSGAIDSVVDKMIEKFDNSEIGKIN